MRPLIIVGALFAIAGTILALIIRGGPHQTLTCSILGICPTFKVEGSWPPEYSGVKDILTKHIANGAELGARTTLYSKGKRVFDVWGGFTKPDHTEQWNEQTIGLIFSCTKVVTALAIAMLVDRGLVEYDQPIAKYWPEFAKHGKDKITLSDFLRHESGLFRFDKPFTYEILVDLSKIATHLENTKPDLTLGVGARSYHALTYGFVPSILLWKVDPKHRTLGQWVHEEIAKPLNLDLYIGLPAEVNRSRLAYVNDGNPLIAITKLLIPYFIERKLGIDITDPQLMKPYVFRFLDSMFNESSILYTAPFIDKEGILHGGPQDPHHYNKESRLVVENGAASGVSNAAFLAKLGALVANGGELDGVRLFSNKVLDQALSDPQRKYDHLLCTDTIFTKGGFSLFNEKDVVEFSLHPAYGWVGWGGSAFVFDTKKNWAFSYVMAGMNLPLLHPAAKEIVELIAKQL